MWVALEGELEQLCQGGLVGEGSAERDLHSLNRKRSQL